MFYMLDSKFWIAMALVLGAICSHVFTYRAGRAAVRAQWDAEKVVQLQEAVRREQELRVKIKQLVDAKNESEAKYVEIKKRMERDADGARAELGRLRDALAATNPQLAKDPAAGTRAAGVAGLERELLGACAQALVGVAAAADRLEAQLVGLQGYVRGVCMKAGE